MALVVHLGSKREVVVDLAYLEEVRDRVVDVSEDAAAGKVQEGQIFRIDQVRPG